MSEQRLSLILAFIFGVVFLGALLGFVVAFPNPTNQQFELVRIVLALAAGGVAAFIPGMLDLRLGAGKNLAVRASGAIAVFVIVYFYSPAHWPASHDGSIVACNGSVAAGRDASGNTITMTTSGSKEGSAPCGDTAPK